MNKVFSKIVLGAACSVMFAGSSLAKEKVELYLMIGQSNMAGRAPLEASDKGEMKGCLLLNQEGKLEAATNPLNRYSTIRKGLGMQKLGPSYSFALEMQKQFKDADRLVGLVVNAKGGSSIKSWNKGSKFFNDAVARVKLALDSKEYEVELKGICWHQGESDHTDKDYGTKLKQMVKDFRAEFKQDKLPFVMGQINQKEGGGDSPVKTFNVAMLKLDDEKNLIKVVKADGLKAYDRWHFDNPSAKELGKRYAKAMLELQK